MKSNYAAWQVQPSLFPALGSHREKLLHLCRYALLAPSGHNSQPWVVTPEEERIAVSAHPTRCISGGESGQLLHVEPAISVGSFVGALECAGLGAGARVRVRLEAEGNQIARISLDGDREPEPGYLAAIVKRVSNRHPYSTTPIPDELLALIAEVDHEGVGVSVITDRDQIELLGALTEEAIERISSRREYRYELAEWVRPNSTGRFDGMPGFTHGVGLVPSLFAKYAMRLSPKMGPPAAHSRELIESTPALVVVGYTSDTRNSHANIGRTFAKVAVRAQKAGLATSALGAAVIDPSTRGRAVDELGLEHRPTIIIRIGEATVVPRHTPRLPLEQIIDRGDVLEA
jgi:hypothetical protein